MYRAFWLDTRTGRAVELKRSGGAVETHMQYVFEHPGAFGFTAEQLDEKNTGPLPYEISEYPEWLVGPLLDRFIKVNVDTRYVTFTTRDRPGRQHIEAMQDFLIDAKLTRLLVFVAGEPSGRMLAKGTSESFLQVNRAAELRRLVASREGKMNLKVGQVWRRQDGLSYRLSRRVEGGWHVVIGQKRNDRLFSTAEWGFTDRHFHNIVAGERLKLAYDPPLATFVEKRLREAGLGRQAMQFAAVDEISKPELRDAQDRKRQLEEKLEGADPAERERLERQAELVDDVLETRKPQVEEPDPVTSPHFVSRDGVAKPNRVTR